MSKFEKLVAQKRADIARINKELEELLDECPHKKRVDEHTNLYTYSDSRATMLVSRCVICGDLLIKGVVYENFE